MDNQLYSNDDSDGALALKQLADEIRAELWPYVVVVRQQISNWHENHQTPIDLLPLPARTLTLAEKCSVLAAVHDCVEEGEPFWIVPEISQPIDDEADQSEFYHAYLNGVPWAVLLSAARRIIPRPKDPLRTLLIEVVDSLSEQVSFSRRNQREPARSSNQNSITTYPIVTSVAMSELSRIADLLRPQLSSPNPAIGLFSWTQELTGIAGERRENISLADATGALRGEPRNIIWCGAETWRQPEILEDENGKALTKPFVGPDGKPVLSGGQPMVVPKQSPIEYRGVVAIDINHVAAPHFLSRGLSSGSSGGAKSDVLKHLHAAGEVLAKTPAAITELWSGIAPPPYPASGAGPLVLWFSAMLTLHEQGILIGELVKPFWHWKAMGPRYCEFAKPGTDCTDLDISRQVAVIVDPIRASLQMIDWLATVERTSNQIVRRIGTFESNVPARFKQLLVDEIFAQAWSIAQKLKSATNYSPETYATFEPQWDRLRDGLNKAGAHLDSFSPRVRGAVEELATIVNQAASGISFADVCKSLAESQLESWADKGWRAFKAITVPPAISWGRSEESISAASGERLTETSGPKVNRSRDDRLLKSLTRVRDRLSRGAETQRSLSALLVHTAGLCFPKPPLWPELLEFQGMYRLNICSGPHSDPEQIFDESGQPAIGHVPFPDKDGNPIVFQDGSPVAMSPGANRTYSLYGDQFPGGSESAYSEACREYMDAAAEAGRIIDDLPIILKQVIWREWPHGFIKPEPCDLWTNAVFELAWKDYEGSGLAADRWTWWANKKLRVDDLANTRQSPLAGMFAELLERAGDPVRYWYSWLPNIWRASIAATDILQSLLTRLSSIESDVTSEVVSRTGGANVTNESALEAKSSAHPTPTIEQLEQEVPILDKLNSQWRKANQLKSLGETAATKSLKEQRSIGKKSSDGKFGICTAGRIWRKDGQDVWYFVPSLLPLRDRSAPLISAALRLISTVD